MPTPLSLQLLQNQQIMIHSYKVISLSSFLRIWVARNGALQQVLRGHLDSPVHRTYSHGNHAGKRKGQHGAELSPVHACPGLLSVSHRLRSHLRGAGAEYRRHRR